MDLSKFELSEDVRAAILAEHEAETAGLKQSRDAVLNEKKELSGKFAEAETAAQEARRIAAEAEEARLKATNDVDGLKKLYEKQLAEATGALKLEVEAKAGALKDRDFAVHKSQALSFFHENHKDVADVMLSNMLKIGYNDDNSVKTTFEYKGEVVADSIESFKSWAYEQPIFKQYLNGVDSSGAGSKTSTNTNTAAKQMSRDSFENLSPTAKMEFSKAGGQLTD